MSWCLVSAPVSSFCSTNLPDRVMIVPKHWFGLCHRNKAQSHMFSTWTAVCSKLDWPTQKECMHITNQWDTGLCFQSEAWKQFSLLGPLPGFSAILLVPGKYLCTSTNTNDRKNLEKKGALPLSFLFIANFLDSFHLLSMYLSTRTHIAAWICSTTIVYKNTTLLYVSVSN